MTNNIEQLEKLVAAMKCASNAEPPSAHVTEWDEDDNLQQINLVAILTEMKEQQAKIEKLEVALENIAEYWNGNANEKAMLDACEHNVETARAALGEQK